MAGRSGAVWVPAWVLAGVAAAVALRTDAAPVSWWMPLGIAFFAVPAAVIISVATEKPWASIHRSLAVLAECVWVTAVARTGWSEWWILGLVGGALIVGALEFFIARARTTVLWVGPVPDGDRRPTPIREWEAMLRRLTKSKKKRGEDEDGWEWSHLRVTAVTPWPDRTAGEQVHVDLPEGMTVKDLATYSDKIAGARRLPQGCVVRVLDGDHQGSAILDVMLRDCLAVDGRTHVEPTTQVSIYDPFTIAGTAKGEELAVHLREKSMVIGGTTGSGKTTLLHRIIMRLARCVDALIWIVDPNGGGVAGPWIGPWARGEASAPTVDWVAEDEVEGAVLVAVATAIVKDRKTSREAIRRKRAANDHVLPVDKDLPLILVITDEGGELRQAAGLLATLVDEGLARLAQVGRAEGGRVIMSILRGTGDLLNKGLRAVVGIRVCLRMEEEDEYPHVLGINPGKVRLLHKGSAFVYRTDTDYRPVLSRTVDVDLASIEQHAIATAGLRPKLDDRGQRIAARITVRDVLDGRNPMDFIDIKRHPVMREVEAGRAYSGRWDRKAAMLAELRGEELPEDDEPTRPAVSDRPTVAPVGSAAERLLIGTGMLVEPSTTTPARPARTDVDAEAAALLSEEHLARDGAPRGEQSRPATAREGILLALRDAYPDPLTNAQAHAMVVELGVEVTVQRVHQVLGVLVERGEVRQDGNGYELIRA